MSPILPRLLPPALLLACLTSARADEGSAAAHFETNVRPLLVERCIPCHGGEKTKGGLKLTSRAAIFAGGDSGPAALAGNPEESLIVQAVRYQDEPRMPPKGKLDDREVEALTRWVADGLAWPDATPEPAAAPTDGPAPFTDEQRRFWSFQPPTPAEPPPVRDAAWPISPIDRFILAGLEAKGLTPAPGADKRTLIRRATFDLTGLPPTPAEVEAFLADDRPDAFGRLVDRLLASPAYGEKWGRHWLDLVRYADARDGRGIGGADDIADAWRYRDWVVDAFNRDLPYDRFVVDQLAGDLLPGDGPDGFNRDGLIATGLLAIGEWGTGDADKEKMMTDIVDDQIDVVGRTFLGLTLACARCHDHKFDPIRQEDYYGLAGIFFSSHILPDPGAKTAGSPMLRTPILPPSELAAIERRKARIAELNREEKATADAAFAALSRSLVPQTARYLLAAWDEKTGDLRADVVRRWSAALGLGDDGRPLDRPTAGVAGREAVVSWRGLADNPSVTINPTASDLAITTERLPARSVSTHPGPRSAVALSWRSPIEGVVRVTGRVADSDRACGDGVAWTLSRRSGRLETALAAGEVANGGARRVDGGTIEVRPGDAIRLIIHPKGEYTCDTTTLDLTITPDDGSARWDLTTDLVADPSRRGPSPWSFEEVGLERKGRVAALAAILGPWDRAVATGDRMQIAQAAEAVGWALLQWPDPAIREALAGADGPFAIRDRGDLTGLPGSVAARLRSFRDELARLKAEPTPAIPTTLAALEGGVPNSPHAGVHDAHIHIRGNYQRLGPVVPRHVPRILAGDEAPTFESTSSGRLELARWIARPDHPTTARVIANRVWQYHFGEGIVRTPSNFGKLGERPTHPELLDYLAQQLVQSGWSLKALHRLAMNSAAYQQSSRATAEALRLDPDNRLFGRIGRRRLEAEEVRDSLLALSGRLDPTRGGPSVRDAGVPRRALYIMTIRSDRSSFGPLFDAADATALVDRRNASTVAPQALYLLNNPFALAAARGLAGRIEREAPAEPRGRIAWTYRLLFGRPPTTEEVEVGLGLIGDGDPAAWQAFAQVLLCTNEFLYVD